MTVTSHLLFFDTFSHENSNIVQLDLVQFPKAVQVSEVRVIPLGARVKADFPGGVRLGATNPSQFEIEFFVNDLKKKGAASFENIGSLRYAQHGTIHLEFNKKPPTDGLLLRGCYNTVTLAVYGNLTTVDSDPSPKSKPDTVVRPPPDKVNTHERIRDWLEDTKRKQQAYEITSSEDTSECEAKVSPEEFDDTERPAKDMKSSPEVSWEFRSKESKTICDLTKESSPEPDREKRREARKNAKDKRKSKGWVSDDNSSVSTKKRNSSEWYEDESDGHENSQFPSTRKSPRPVPAHSPTPEKPSGATREAPLLPPPIPSEEMEAISDDEVIPEFIDDFERISSKEREKDVPNETDKNNCAIHPPIEEPENCEYEEIMSDEDDLPEYQYEEAYVVEEWETWIRPFDPHCVKELSPLLFIQSPTCTPFEEEVNRKDILDSKSDDKIFLGLKLSNLFQQTVIPSVHLGETKENESIVESPGEDGEMFVQAMEDVCRLLPKALVWLPNQEELPNILSKWVSCGLNSELALSHPQPVYKIRHMKAGIRLCSLLLQCSSDITDELLKTGILNQLFLLFNQPHISLSLKLLIIKTFDAVLTTSSGIRFMISERLENGFTSFEGLLKLLPALQQSRTKACLSVVIRKIHFIEVCERFHSDVSQLVDFVVRQMENNDLGSDTRLSEVGKLDESHDEVAKDKDMPEALIQSILSCLKTILNVYSHARHLLIQFIRCLPGSKQFQLPKCNNEYPFQFIYNVFDLNGVLESISVLLLCRISNRNFSVLKYVKSILVSLLKSDHGVRYLAAKEKTTSLIIKSLLKFSDENRTFPHDGDSLAQLGLRMNTSMYIVHHLDCLFTMNQNRLKLLNSDHTPEKGKKLIDISESSLFHLNALESLMNSAMGRKSLVSVIGLPNLAECLFPYLKLGSDSIKNPLMSSKMACFGYAVDLFLHVVKYQDDVEYLEFYLGSLNELLRSWDASVANAEEGVKLDELSSWISLLKTPGIFAYDHFSVLANVVQEHTENIEKFPGELISTLRVLSHLAVPRHSTTILNSEMNKDDLVEELKYKYAIIQLYSLDLSTHLTHLLSRLFSIYQQPFLHCTNFIGSEGASVIAIVKPTLTLLNAIFGAIIQARNNEFRDVSAVVPLIQTYMLLHAFPNSSPHYKSAQVVKQSVVDVLLRFTQIIYTTEGEDVLAKSLWTQMISEIFKYMMQNLQSMVSVMTLLTELLPLPLPLQTYIPLKEDESEHLVRMRKLWSAHLYPLSSVLQEIIHKLGLATNPQLVHSLRRLCVSISDLSSPMALLVSKVILDLLLQSHRLDQKSLLKEEQSKEEPNPLQPQTSQCIASQQTCRSLKMLSSFITHPPIKVAVLHLLNGGSTQSNTPTKYEDKYTSLITIFHGILSTVASETNKYHSTAQEYLLSLLNGLCDPKISLQNVQTGELSLNTTTLCSIPPKEILLPTIEGVVEVIQNSNCSFRCLRFAFEIFVSLLETNYGVFYLKSVFDKKKDCLVAPLRHLCSKFDYKENELVSVLRDFLHFCLLCLSPPDPERNGSVTTSELILYLQWSSETSETIETHLPTPSSNTAAKEASDDTQPKTELNSDDKEAEEAVEEKVDKTEDEEQTVDKTEDEEQTVDKTEDEEQTVDKTEDEEQTVDTKENKEQTVDTKENKEHESSTENIHPLKKIEKLLQMECIENNEEHEHLKEQVSLLISKLENESPIKATTELEEPSVRMLETLQSQFASRLLWSCSLSTQKNQYQYWISSPPVDNSTPTSTVTVNLMEMSEKYVTDFDLTLALNKVIKGQGSHVGNSTKIGKMLPKYKASASAIRADPGGKAYVAPLRGGRPFVRGHIRSDPFRSRPPNTSRPPSLHVDDFVALESTGHQPTGPTGYNKISFGRGKMMLDSMRSRGRGRGDGRGRFFVRHPFRGDGSRGLNRGHGIRRATGWIFRGETGVRPGFRGTHLHPSRFIRGRPFAPVGLTSNAATKERFPIRFPDMGRRDLPPIRHPRGFR